MNQETIKAISQAIKRDLVEYEYPEDPRPIRLSPLNPRTLSYTDGEPIPDEEADRLIEEWVKESLEKYGVVACYTCRDNQEIAIEELRPEETEDISEYWVQDSQNPLLYWLID
jgi:hypothetical protein